MDASSASIAFHARGVTFVETVLTSNVCETSFKLERTLQTACGSCYTARLARKLMLKEQRLPRCDQVLHGRYNNNKQTLVLLILVLLIHY